MPLIRDRGYSVPFRLDDQYLAEPVAGYLYIEPGLEKGDSYAPASWPVWLIANGFVPVKLTTIQAIYEEPNYHEYRTDWGQFKSPITALKQLEVEPDDVEFLQPLPKGVVLLFQL